MQQYLFFTLLCFFLSQSSLVAQNVSESTLAKEASAVVERWQNKGLSEEAVVDSCGQMFWQLQDTEREKAYQYVKIGLEIAKKQRYYKGLHSLNICLSSYKGSRKQHKEAILILLENLEIAKRLGDVEYVISLNSLAQSYKSLSDNRTALRYLTKAGEIAKKINHTWLIAYNYYYKALIYHEYNIGSRAKTLLRKSIQTFESIKNQRSIVVPYGLIISIYVQEQKLDSVVYFAQKNIKVCEVSKNQGALISTLNELTKIYLIEKQYQEADNYNRQALALINNLEVPNTNLEQTCLLRRIEILQARKSYQIALKLANENQDLFLKNASSASQYYLLKAKIYQALEDFPQAYYYKSLGDSLLFNKMKQKRAKIEENIDLMTEISTLEQAKELAELERKEIAQDRLYIAVALGLITLLCAVILFFYRRSRKMAKVLGVKNDYIDQQHQKLQKEHEQLDTYKKHLESKHLELQQTHEELKSQSDIIAQLNSDLEQKVRLRTESLAKRNEMLEAYANYNSHVLRAPIARLVGLSNILLEMDLPKEDHNEMLRHVARSSQLLDDVTRYMQKLLETEDEEEFRQLIKNPPDLED